jgi:hypothetical protein
VSEISSFNELAKLSYVSKTEANFSIIFDGHRRNDELESNGYGCAFGMWKPYGDEQ